MHATNERTKMDVPHDLANGFDQENYFFNLPLRFWMLYKMHPLVEHQKRLQLVNILKDPSLSPLVRYSLEELYEIRDELH